MTAPVDQARVAEIARGLTKGECTGLRMSRPGQPMAYVALQAQVRIRMFTEGLIERALDAEDDDEPLLFRLTPLGLAVRAELIRQETSHG